MPYGDGRSILCDAVIYAYVVTMGMFVQLQSFLCLCARVHHCKRQAARVHNNVEGYSSREVLLVRQACHI